MTDDDADPELAAFRELVGRVRGGDAAAAQELVRTYAPAIRLAVRARLTDPRLRRVLDSEDICQDVLKSFFVRVASGQYTLDEPAQLIALLRKMARNKVVKEADKERAGRRDCRRMRQGANAGEIVDPSPNPSDAVAAQDLLREFRGRLSDEARRLADYRASGWTWEEIAAQLGGNSGTLRIKLAREVAHVAQQMGIE